MTETPKKKTAAKKATKASVKSETASSSLPFDLPKFELPKFELPNFDLPKLDFPKLDLPKVEVPTQVSEAAERGRDFVTDSVKSARSAAGSVRKNVAETVVLVREAVGV
jgi:hypothetical protein